MICFNINYELYSYMQPFLDLQQLKALYLLGQTGSYTMAAQKLGRTQSAVSHAIKKLEDGLGVKLVAKTGRKFHFTDEGETLFASCEKVFYSLDQAVESISFSRGESLGKITLGTTVEFGCSILIKQFEPFIVAHPEIEVDFHMDHNLITPLLSDELDIIIDCVDHQIAGIQRTPLFRELYAVVCSPSYKITHNITKISTLSKCTILSLDISGSWWHNFIYSIPGNERPSLKKHRFITINLIRGMIAAAENGIGVALVPKYSVIGQLQKGSLIQLFPHIHLLEDQFSIYQKETRAKLKRHTLVTDYLKTLRPQELTIPPSEPSHK
jgi:LysR family transcriptional regulator, glycine cleavage system transcriptional activator